jgi:transcriptional regulator of acetoin/glycerol metabolism
MEILRDVARPADAPPRVDDDALRELCKHRWPGNVRELRNVIERAFLLSQRTGCISRELIRSMLHPERTPYNRGESESHGAEGVGTLAECEREQIVRVLRHCKGNFKHAARILGISRSTLYAKLRRLDISRIRVDASSDTLAEPERDGEADETISRVVIRDPHAA